MIAYVYDFLTALVTTISIELILVLLLTQYLGLIVASSRTRTAFVVVGVNILTLPYVWFVFPYLIRFNLHFSLFLSEVFAWLFEALLYKYLLSLNWKKALFISFIANAGSFAAGYLVR